MAIPDKCAKCPVYPVCALFGPVVAHITLGMMEAELAKAILAETSETAKTEETTTTPA